jgi:hypothetical protein
LQNAYLFHKTPRCNVMEMQSELIINTSVQKGYKYIKFLRKKNTNAAEFIKFHSVDVFLIL